MSLVQLNFDATTGIARLAFDRPEVLNALDVPLARALNERVQGLAQQAGVRCVVLSGNGRAFMAGGDLARFADDFDHADVVVDELLDALHPAILTLRQLDAPVLASVHGAVAGAGLSLMAGCDLVLAAQGTRFVMAYDRVGASPDCGGTYDLPRLLGGRRAAQFYLFGETLSSEEALAIGLVNQVVAADALAAMTHEWATRIAAGPTRAYGNYRRLVQQTWASSLTDQLERERASFKAATRTRDFRAGVQGFLRKHSVSFNGQ
ncbi:enoyl-CoA hydratase/isomerase family protein [Paraburkholderia sp. IW21]|uniref:enoyl-CoA hydratase/isomerase family protein n=1 Tax=Paraburkholderia sp. IW21 TaxID=3242488 RepID=UPI0035207DF7